MRKKRETKYVTIKDVAKEADVSIATVSRVLNNGRVKPERKRRVLDAMHKLNYTPNNSARNLASVNATKRVSFVVPSLSSFYTPFIEGFKSGLSLYKYEGVIEIFYKDQNIFDEICLKQEANAEVRGIVQFAPKRELSNKNVISMLESNPELNYVISDELKATKIGLYFPDDPNIDKFFSDVIFANSDVYNIDINDAKNYDIVITNHIDSAFALLNSGYTGTIKTLENSENVNKIHSNIQTLNLDMYGLGVYLSRVIIKKVNMDEENNQTIDININ